MRRKLLLLFLLSCGYAQANVIRVINTDNSGVGSLRDAIENVAVANDTILIDVKGTILLQSTININAKSNLTIIGPTAKHCTIQDAAAFSGSSLVDIINSSNIHFSYIGFVATGSNDTRAVRLATNTGPVSFTKCLFKDFNTTNEGGAISSLNTTINLSSCSFVNNNANFGGALVLTTSTSLIENCTFYDNSGVVQAGAIQVGNTSTVTLTHNTIYQNTAPGGTGSGLFSNTALNVINLTNNAISNNGAVDGQFSGLATYTSNGGNVYRKNSAADNVPWGAHALDDIATLLTFNYRATILTDGYGLMYYPIVNQTSALVDQGVPTPLSKDSRGAPRVLKSSNASPVNPDAGACEYTGLRVTNPTSASATPNTIGWVFLPGQNYNSVNFVEFDLGSVPITLTSDVAMNLNGNYIVDGYSQSTSAVPGPAVFGALGVTPAVLPVTISNGASIANGFTISGTSTTGSISGLRIISFSQGAINCSADNFQIFGCEIGITSADVSAPNLFFGIKMDGDNGLIGGRWHWQRNVVSGNGTGGGANPEITISTGVTNTQILGNIIGLRRDGTTIYSGTVTQYGIYNGGNNTLIGDVGAGNVISNKTEGINCVNVQNAKITGNTIGLDYNQTVAKGNATGININSNCLNVEIGKPVMGGGNIISGNSSVGIRIDAASGVKVSNNFIGPDKTGNSGPAVTTTHGIYFDDNSANNVLIGGPNLLDRNIISKNGTAISIIRAGTGMIIQNNIIGLNASGNAVLTNTTAGIQVQNTVINAVQIGTSGSGNIISGHSSGSGCGIEILGSTLHVIQGNLIGTSADGNSILANNYGIHISGSSDVLIGGDYLLNQGNIISGNTQAGVHVNNNASNTLIRGNFIGTNIAGIVALPNGTSGVWIEDAAGTVIGGLPVYRNTISGQVNFSSQGIRLSSNGLGTNISANIIGQNNLGTSALGNYQGIHIEDSHEAYVGGVNPNYITSSTDAGIVFASSSPATIEGNMIGKSLTGIVAGMSNLYGILIQSPNAVIGSAFPNVIVNSNSHGVLIDNETADGTLINGNYIGTDASLAVGMGNDGDGIHIVDADDTEIGVTNGNTIIGNTQAGIYLTGSVEGSLISNNTIYAPGGVSMTNQYGIYLENGPTGNFIGTGYGVDGDNTIGNSTADGIRLDNADANFVYGNDIGNDGNGLFPNLNGIRILNSTGNIIGDIGGKINVISGNTSTGILLENAIGTVIQSNFIGTNVTGNGPVSNNNGIEILSGSTGTIVGGIGNIALANTISANLNIGIRTESSTTSIYKNYIGPTQGGLGALGFQNYGIVVEPGATTCVIGGEFSSQGNMIASNENAGILVKEEGVSIKGNIIGASGTFAILGTQPIGIELATTSAFDAVIGSPVVGASEFGNVILNHSVAGIQLHTGAHDNLIQSNYIGVDPSNGTSMTQLVGIEILVTAGIDNQIGSDVAGGQNRISGNTIGIQLDGAVHTFIYNNRIGLAIDELNSNANTQNGIHLIDAGFNTIGGTGLKSNIISGNTQNGILIEGISSTDNVVTGNIIGASGSLIQINPNGVGIKISNGASNNAIGEVGIQSGNTICGNNAAGILIDNAPANEIFNNKIGLPFGNNHGIIIQNGSSNNIVGGTPSERNIISNNDSMGVAINGASNNIVAGNFIGTNENGNLPAGNKIGVFMSGGSFNTIGNQTNFNLISSNQIAGVSLENSPSNTFKNNFIGTNETGDATFAGSGNGAGVVFINSNLNLFGGNNTIDEENVVCNNGAQGIYLENSDLNEIYGNKIGINKSGTVYISNIQEGVLLRSGSDNNTIGSSVSGLSNSIGGNSKGIYVKNSNSNIIAANYIGNNIDGTAVLTGSNNQQIGIHLDSASASNTISSTNVISGNLNKGVLIQGSDTKENTVIGNFVGLDATGNISLPNGTVNIHIADSAYSNIIGGSTALDRNYIGGDVPIQIVIENVADSNQIAGNYIGLGFDASSTYLSNTGIKISNNSKFNIVGGGLAGEGNTLVDFELDAIHIFDANNNSVLGNRIGLKPDSSPGSIDSAGVLLEGADYTWIGSYLVGSDSMNIITNCNTGVEVTTYFLNSSYGNVIGGNAIYNNINQGIDLIGDDQVMPIDTNNSNIFIDNGGMDRPEIVSAWSCDDGFTHVGFKFFASNALPNYHVEFYRNPVPDGSGYGEGEIFLGDFIFSPATNYDTISINLGQTLTPGTVLTATITGVLGNTSEFSQQYIVTVPPPIVAPVTTVETCLGAANGTVAVIAAEAYLFTWDAGTTWIAGNGAVTSVLPSGTYTLDALYLNGCTQSTPVILNPGTALPFSYTIIPDTCGYNVGEIILDTVSTNLSGGSGNYTYTFTNGAFYGSAIDTLNLTTGTYSVGLQDLTLGCFSVVEDVVVNEITDVIDESFVFDSFCALGTPIPSSIATGGGVFSFETIPSDGATINTITGLITGAVVGSSYEVIYTVGICSEKDTILVTALDADDATFTFADFCTGSPQSIVVTGLAGGTFSFDPLPTDGAVIDPLTGIITGATGTSYIVKYVTNGPCPDSTSISVTVFATPAAPQIIATDSIYCGTEAPAMLSVVSGTDIAMWMIGSSSSTVVTTADDFTPSALNYGSNYIYVILSDGGSCFSAADSINYYRSDLSVLSAGNDLETCIGSKIQLGASGGLTYAWNDNDDLSELDVADPIAHVFADSDYIVTITDIYGCQRIDSINVTLLPVSECNVETYNAFSPNGDGTNDSWIIDGIEGYSQNTVTVYNRWGDILIQFENYNNTSVVWDGITKSGNDALSGTYFFVVNVNGDQNQTGWVQVVR